MVTDCELVTKALRVEITTLEGGVVCEVGGGGDTHTLKTGEKGAKGSLIAFRFRRNRVELLDMFNDTTFRI